MTRWNQCDVLAEELRSKGIIIRLSRKNDGATAIMHGDRCLHVCLDAGELWSWLQGVLCGMDLLQQLYQER